MVLRGSPQDLFVWPPMGQQPLCHLYPLTSHLSQWGAREHVLPLKWITSVLLWALHCFWSCLSTVTCHRTNGLVNSCVTEKENMYEWVWGYSCLEKLGHSLFKAEYLSASIFISFTVLTLPTSVLLDISCKPLRFMFSVAICLWFISLFSFMCFCVRPDRCQCPKC